MKTVFENFPWLDMESVPQDGTPFLMLLSNGWITIASWRRPEGRQARYEWWITETRISVPVVDTHQNLSDRTIVAVGWMPLPPVPEWDKIENIANSIRK